MHGSKEVDIINNSDIYDAHKDPCLSEKRPWNKLLQGIQSANGLMARAGAKKAKGPAVKVSNKQKTVKKTFSERFATSLDSDFFKHFVYPYERKEDLIVMLEFKLLKWGFW